MEEELFEQDTNYLDQHFLVDKEVINNFINLCNIKKDEDNKITTVEVDDASD